MSGAARVALAAALVAALAATAPVAAQASSEPVFEIALSEDGSARITLSMAFDLTTDAEATSFETLRRDTQARADVTSRFRRRMGSVANQSEETTGREMRVHDAAMNLTTADGGKTGIVSLSVAWENLAAVRDGHLVVTEPFASGYTPDRKFVVRIVVPEGFRLTAARPTPDARDDASVSWAAGTDLDGFRVVFSPAGETPLPSPTPGADGTTRSGGQPGMGAALAAVALLVAGVGAVARRRLR